MGSSYQSAFYNPTTELVSDGNIPRISRFQAQVINPNQVIVVWSFENGLGSNFNVNDFDFSVLRGHSEIEDFVEVSSPMEGVYEWIDQPQSLQSAWRRIFYKLKVVHRVSGDESIIGPISMHENMTPSMIALRIINDFNMLLANFPVGVEAFAFISKLNGGRCSCYDYVEQMSTNPRCEYCFGTGWNYPYSKIPVKINIGLNADTEIVTIDDGEKEGDERSFWTTNWPDFKKNDCIYVPSKRMVYRVVKKQWLSQESAVVGIKQGLRVTPVGYETQEYKQLNLSHNLDEIKDYLDVTWTKGGKTYFGCRTGLPLQPTNRKGTK